MTESLFVFLRRWLLPLSIANHERRVERICRRDRERYESERVKEMEAWRK